MWLPWRVPRLHMAWVQVTAGLGFFLHAFKSFNCDMKIVTPCYIRPCLSCGSLVETEQKRTLVLRGQTLVSRRDVIAFSINSPRQRAQALILKEITPLRETRARGPSQVNLAYVI